MQSLFDQGPPAPCPRPFNMAAHVLSHARRLSDKTALSLLAMDGPVTDWRFGEIEARVRGLAQGFLDLGLKSGDIVLLRLGNTPDFPIAYLAAIAVDLLPVPSSSQLTEPEVASMI